MVMLEVRNSIAGILDRHTLADTVRGSLANMRACATKLPYETT